MAHFYLLGNTSDCQMFGCVVQTAHKTIVIDGGTVYDDQQMIDFLRKRANGCVHAWFFTHPHHDHIGCFVAMRKKFSDITVDKVYHHFPGVEELIANARSETEEMLAQDIEQWDSFWAVQKLSAGDMFEFDEVSVQVLRVYNPEMKDNLVNNSSTVYRIDGPRSSILILGDLGVEGGNELMQNCPLALLQTDYTQMAHHGQWGVSKEFYDYVKPKACIWPSPDWLWDNDVGDGYDTGPYQTVRTREWVSALGVTSHFVEKDGIQRIEI